LDNRDEFRKAFGLITITIALVIITIILPSAQANLLSHSPEVFEQPSLVSQPANTPPTGVYFDHLVFIIMENAGISDICGSTLPPPCNGPNTPYMSSLANSYGIETQYVDLAGSSQPNYIGIMAATLNGCTSGCGSNSLTEVNLVDRFEAAGLSWKAYMEDQTPTAGCDNSDHGFYEFIHNPFVSFHDIDTNATRCNKIVLANPANNSTCAGTDCALINDLNSGSPANFMWLTPNDCDNMHGNSACSNKCTTSYTAACNKAGDNYLSGLVPNILNSNTFKNTRAALFITFDEGSGFCPSPNPSGADCMYTVWAGPTTKTTFSSNHADTHYFFTKTIETNWGLATMTSNDAGASAMAEFFAAPSPDFSISASSPAPTNAGQSSTSTITVTALNGFTGTVSLADTIPSGLTCGSISPNSISGSGTSTVSCNASSAGNYTLTITGTSGSLIHTATSLFQFRDFTIAASIVTVNAGTSSPSTITVAAVNRFAGTVTLTDSVPSGLVCGSITPSTVTGSGTATVSCSAATAANYTLTITGTSGSLIHTASSVFHVQDFGITGSSPAPVNAGSSSTSTITISAINHFGGVVSLADTVPSGLSCGSITPNSVAGSGIATVSCSANVAGNYTLTLTATSGSLTHTASAVFQFRDFTVTTSPPTPIDAGSSSTTTVTVVGVNHFAGVVSLTDTLTSGLSCGTITPSSITGSGTATVSCSATVAGNYTLTINASSGTLTHSATVIVQVVDFAVFANPSTVTILVGTAGNSTVTVTAANGFTGTVNLALTSSMGLTATISPNSITGSGSSTLTVSASTSADHSITLRATSGSLSHTIGVTVHVEDYSLTGNPINLIAPVGSSTGSTLTLQSLNGYSRNVTLAFTVQSSCTATTSGGSGGGRRGLLLAPPTVLPSVSISPQMFQLFPGGTQQAVVSASLPSDLLACNYPIIITSSDGTLSHQLVLTVVATDFSVTPTPNTISIQPGSNSTIVLNFLSLNFFEGNVTLTVTSQAGGPTGSLSSSALQLFSFSNVNLNLTIQVPSNTALGNYTITVQATSGTLTHTLTIPVRVTATGFVSTLGALLSPHNAPPISAAAIITLLTILAMVKVRGYQAQRPSTFKRSRIENGIHSRRVQRHYHPCSSSLPVFWLQTSTNEF
jgi:hypothetical protein